MRVFIRNTAGRFEVKVNPSATVATLKAAYIASGKLFGDAGFICLTHHNKVGTVPSCVRIWCNTLHVLTTARFEQ